MKVLVTGASGFIGQHRVANLLDKGIDVIATGRSASATAFGLDMDVDHYYRLDIAERDVLKEIVLRHKPDRIEHFASLAIVSVSRQDPFSAYRTNVLGVVNVLEAAKAADTPMTVVFTTDKYYGDKKVASETDTPHVMAGAYETSKYCQDVIAQSYATAGLGIKILRSCNVYGDNDRNSRIIPNTLRTLMKGDSPFIYDNILGVRQYIYIKDLMNAIDVIVHRGKKLEYNIGTEDLLPQSSVVEEIVNVWNECHGTGIEPSHTKGRDINEIPRQYLDWGRLKSLGWSPIWKFKESIEDIIGIEKI
ncbi:MAG: NAD-dependent epimerase/dehydratase family protein [Bacillati bacterium]